MSVLLSKSRRTYQEHIPGPTPKLRVVNILRCLLLALLATSLVSCASSRKPKSQARIYEEGSNPSISMHDEAPGSPVGR